MMNPNMAEALRDNFEKSDGLPTEGAEQELVVAIDLQSQASGLDRIISTEEHDPSRTETTKQPSLEEQLSEARAQAVEAATPWYLKEYFSWERNDKGAMRLVPIPHVVEDLIQRIPERLNRAGTEYNTDLKPHLKDLVASYKAIDDTDRALFSNDGNVKGRHKALLDSAISSLLYSAQTRLELERWQASLNEKGLSRPENFNAKAERGAQHAKQGLLSYSVLHRLDPELAAKFSESIAGVVKNRMWTKANIETRNLTSPDTAERVRSSEAEVDASMADIF